MTKRFLSFFLLVLVIISCSETNQENDKLTTSIAFGSCSWESHPLPILNHVVDHNPDYFIFLGDNIYGDTKNMDTLKVKYNRLGNQESYKNLKANVPILATWDDHDYGWNDTGKNYEFKEESKEIFLDFFNEPTDSPRRDHQGIYHSYIHEYGEHKLQIILLDGRTFRDDLLPYNGEFKDDNRYSFYRQDYAIHKTDTPALLGKQQWEWLEQQLSIPADVRIICSGTQFGIEWNGYEAWANYPHEQQRMLETIKETKANGVLFLSGDVHYSELSKLETDFYPIYDFTSSGLSSTWLFATPNANRIEGPIMDNHFGLLGIQWRGAETTITMETFDSNKNKRIDYEIPLSELQGNWD